VSEGVAPHAILAPQQGVIRNIRGQPTAWVVDRNNKAELRDLTVSRAIGHDWLVTSGLVDGDRLIVQGTLKVQSGMPVRPETVNLATSGSTPAAGSELEN
jgi:membrane fusion protein, multidrug efflux system